MNDNAIERINTDIMIDDFEDENVDIDEEGIHVCNSFLNLKTAKNKFTWESEQKEINTPEDNEEKWFGDHSGIRDEYTKDIENGTYYSFDNSNKIGNSRETWQLSYTKDIRDIGKNSFINKTDYQGSNKNYQNKENDLDQQTVVTNNECSPKDNDINDIWISSSNKSRLISENSRNDLYLDQRNNTKNSTVEKLAKFEDYSSTMTCVNKYISNSSLTKRNNQGTRNNLESNNSKESSSIRQRYQQ